MISNNQNATTSYGVMKAIYQYQRSGDTIPVVVSTATSVSGSSILPCSVVRYYVISKQPDQLYYGKVGSYTLCYEVTLPTGYKSMSPSWDYDLLITVDLEITHEQTPKDDLLWIDSPPIKLSYKQGETLDLTGLRVMVLDTTQAMTPYIYVEADNLAAYGLELRLVHNFGEVITTSTPLELSMDHKYIFIVNKSNNSSAIFGPITVTD